MEDKRDFDFDLAEGEFVEGLVKDILTNKVTAPAKVKFEVKSDRMARSTGNLFFEYKDRGKPSGLSVTKAEWFVVNLKEHDNSMLIFFATDYLKKRLLKLLEKEKAKKQAGGDENLAKGILVKFQDLLSDRKS